MNKELITVVKTSMTIPSGALTSVNPRLKAAGAANAVYHHPDPAHGKRGAELAMRKQRQRASHRAKARDEPSARALTSARDSPPGQPSHQMFQPRLSRRMFADRRPS